MAAALGLCLLVTALLPAALPAPAFLAGLLLGWPGVLGAALGSAVGSTLGAGLSASAPGLPLLMALGAGFAAAVAAAVPFLVFRHVPGLGRGVPNLRSYLWLLAAGALAAVLSAAAGWAMTGGGPLLEPWTAAFLGLAAIAFTAPLGAILLDLAARRWMAPIAGELPARRTLALAEVVRFAPRGGGSATRVLAPPKRPVGGSVATVLAAIALLTVVVVPVLGVIPAGGHWTLLAYLAPILWTASVFGLRGAVAAASASALVFVAGQAVWQAASSASVLAGSDLSWRSAYAELVLFGLVGAYAGTASEREHALRSEVFHRNQLLRLDLLRVVQALTNAVEAKDVYTEGHLRRVSDYAVRVAEELGVQGPSLEMVFFASMLHDIGKIGVPEEILTKPGPLTPEERTEMQRHAEVGARILQNLDVLRDAAPLVRHHQERWDGRRDGPYPGYPAGLSGDAIPLGSRIIAVVDAFDAMTTDRPYRASLGVDAALAELRREAGKQFDPRVVEVFVAQLEAHPWSAEVA